MLEESMPKFNAETTTVGYTAPLRLTEYRAWK